MPLVAPYLKGEEFASYPDMNYKLYMSALPLMIGKVSDRTPISHSRIWGSSWENDIASHAGVYGDTA